MQMNSLWLRSTPLRNSCFKWHEKRRLNAPFSFLKFENLGVIMTAKKPTAAEKEAAAQKKADEVAALMGDDVEASATQKPSAPPEIKNSTGATEVEKAEAEKAEAEKAEAEKAEAEKAEAEKAEAEKAEAEKAEAEKAEAEKAEAEKAEAEKVAAEKAKTEKAKAKVGHMVILHKTIHTKDADGKDVKFIASKDPQDLGEYGDMAIAAGCAKPHKAG
jgi:DNA polymerase III gamma/tau subunit